jgi:hypothetical protein
MVTIILQAFGWLGILGGIVALVGWLMPSLPLIGPVGSLALGMTGLLNGAMLLGFAQLIGAVTALVRQVEPLAKIGTALAPRYGVADGSAMGAEDTNALDAIVLNPPANAQVYANGSFRVVLMVDGRVIAQSAEGTKAFATLEDYKKFAGLG